MLLLLNSKLYYDMYSTLFSIINFKKFTTFITLINFRTREEIVGLFYNHIKAVNQIYESTDFGGVRGLNFVIRRTSVS